MKTTNWNRYYDKPYKAATFTRNITGRVLANYISRHVKKGSPVIIELGGANSCFFERIYGGFEPDKYVVVDNNQLGLDKFLERGQQNNRLRAVNADVLNLDIDLKGDLVFSVGLIEHFSPQDTAKAVKAHFLVLKDDGVLIMSFPTPTILYRVTRRLSEALGLWIFHDERPLKIKEVVATVEKYGLVLQKRIIWSIFLTQAVVVARKTGEDGV